LLDDAENRLGIARDFLVAGRLGQHAQPERLFNLLMDGLKA